MSPRTLFEVLDGAPAPHDMDFGIGAVSKRPYLAIRVAEVLTAYANIEAEIVRVAAQSCRADPALVAGMWAAMRAGVQDVVLLAMIQQTLPPEDADLFSRVLNGPVRAGRDERNVFAHHLWGVTEILPEALLVVSPKVAVRSDAQRIGALRAIWDKGITVIVSDAPVPMMGPSGWNTREITVYDVQDLFAEVSRAHAITSKLVRLGVALRPEDRSSAQLRTELLAEMAPPKDQSPKAARKPRAQRRGKGPPH